MAMMEPDQKVLDGRWSETLLTSTSTGGPAAVGARASAKSVVAGPAEYDVAVELPVQFGS
jgi:hypothetical protein